LATRDPRTCIHEGMYVVGARRLVLSVGLKRCQPCRMYLPSCRNSKIRSLVRVNMTTLVVESKSKAPADHVGIIPILGRHVSQLTVSVSRRCPGILCVCHIIFGVPRQCILFGTVSVLDRRVGTSVQLYTVLQLVYHLMSQGLLLIQITRHV